MLIVILLQRYDIKENDIKEIDIKSQTYNFFDDMMKKLFDDRIKKLDSNKTEIEKNLYKRIHTKVFSLITLVM